MNQEVSTDANSDKMQNAVRVAAAGLGHCETWGQFIRLVRAAYSGHIWKRVGMSCTRYCELLAAAGMKHRRGYGRKNAR